MKKSEIFKIIKNKYNDDIVTVADESIDATILLKPEHLYEFVEFINCEEDLQFNVCHSISGLDTGVENPISVVYHFTSFKFNHWMTVKVTFEGRENCEIQTLSDIYDGANWLERETFDLYGIKFIDHPDLRRILTPDDWKGHPLLKDYETPETYQDVKNKPENDWNSNAFKFPE